MTGRAWLLVVDSCGRPLLSNAVAKLNGFAATRERAPWKDAATVLARQQRIPRLARISVTAQARYRTRRSPSDCDAPSPALKGVLDGLVVAGVIKGDCPPFVAWVKYLSPQLGTGLPDALVVLVEEAE